MLGVAFVLGVATSFVGRLTTAFSGMLGGASTFGVAFGWAAFLALDAFLALALTLGAETPAAFNQLAMVIGEILNLVTAVL